MVVAVVFSPTAQNDLLDIALYIAEDNVLRATKFVSELETECKCLGKMPKLGIERPELGQGIRLLPHRNYLIFYREEKTTIRIERILHGARDIDADDFELIDAD